MTFADKWCLQINLNVAGNEIVSHCISSEPSERSENSVAHLHCFLQLRDCIFIEELCEYLRCIYLDCPIDVQPCRSRKSCLKYVSKEDTDLLTNVKTSDLHFNYQCYKWACETHKFDCTHPFVVKHRFQYRFLERYLIHHSKKIY